MTVALHGQLLTLYPCRLQAWATMGVGSGNTGKPKQLQHLQRQTFAGRNSAASASQVSTASWGLLILSGSRQHCMVAQHASQ